MGNTSAIVGQIMDDDDNSTAEAFLSLMVGDPVLAANTVADVLEAAAEVYAHAAVGTQLIHGIVNELDPTTRVFLEMLVDATRRQKIFQERLPFIDWIANGQPSTDPLADKLLDIADRPDWPEPTTFSEYREHLTSMIGRGQITGDDLEHFQTTLWPQYVADGLVMVGDECNITQEWQYGLEVRWDDGHRERPAGTAYGTNRLEAERLYRHAACHETTGKPALQRRLSVHGPWVDVR